MTDPRLNPNPKYLITDPTLRGSNEAADTPNWQKIGRPHMNMNMQHNLIFSQNSQNGVEFNLAADKTEPLSMLSKQRNITDALWKSLMVLR